MGSKNHRFYKGKPKLNFRSRYDQGVYKPINPEKYCGDVNNIVYRSGLEKRWYTFFDLNPSIVAWKCEETVIQYISPIDNQPHRYFVDVYIKYNSKSEGIKEAIVEIKPFEQVKRPGYSKTRSKSYIHKVNTYIVNEAKWNAAKSQALKKGMDFKILTETGFVEWKITTKS
jgi:hypothetical protein